ncbi:hypothetical protein [Sphaerisporangium rubeum]|uniref:Uncharacterized protein n=1 Tax=Sphaerisporangium rubeum TaxID=321317 RepID=A0A7X0M996_9ACTN|nr:hypothetical protein [Sphaerisporangium rubeum]MBB6474829.1 hypothetical protein [Sphaerisporangium rubeum]
MPPNSTRLYQAVLRDKPAVLRHKTAPISIRLRGSVGGWLAGKGLPPLDAGRPQQDLEADGTRARSERKGDCGRYRIEESIGDALLRTRIVYHEAIQGMAGWVTVTVEETGVTGAGHAPGFLPEYLRKGQVTDGAVDLTDTPDIVDEHDVPRLIDTLTARDRRVPLIVVTDDPKDQQAARARADHLAAATAGAGLVVRLADARAEHRFNTVLGSELGVFAGAIRTYLAPFDPKTERYPTRHRWTGPGPLRSRGDEALDVIAGGAVGDTAYRELPDDVRRAIGKVSQIIAGKAAPADIHEVLAPRPTLGDLDKQDMYRRMMALTVRRGTGVTTEAATTDEPVQDETPPPPAADSEPADQDPRPSQHAPVPDTDEFARTVARIVLNDLRGDLEAALDLAVKAAVNAPDTGDLRRHMRTLGAHLDGLRDAVLTRPHPGRPASSNGVNGVDPELEHLRAEHENLQTEYAEAMASARKLERRVRWLETRLAASTQPPNGTATNEPDFEPDNLMDAVTMARDTLTRVTIGDTDAAATKLDLAFPTLAGVWAAKLWDSLRALNAFAEARSSGEFSGGFLQWCMSAAAEVTIPAGMVAMSESKSVHTNGRYSTSRTFPVPKEVNPAGKVLMEAHIKLRQGGHPAPRIHFYDDSGGATGKIWVGYVGDHLPNTLTN